jgi:hypothetical protein
MLKSWFEYIKENVDPDMFNGIVYLRSQDNSSEQFWFYIYSKSPEYLDSVERNSIDLIQLASFYISPELEYRRPHRFQDVYVYIENSDIKYIDIIKDIFDHPISVYGITYRGDRNKLIEQIKNLHNKNLGDQHFIFKVVQVQLIELQGTDDFDVIDYYL